MASTTISDAVVFPQDEGTGVPDGNEDYDSAGYHSLMSQSTTSPYKNGLELSSLDTTNDTVDVAAGHAFVQTSNNSVQSGSQTSYDTTLSSDMMYLVVLPTSWTVDLDTDTDADLNLVVDPTQQDAVTIEHNTSPADPSLTIGRADSSGGGFVQKSYGRRASFYEVRELERFGFNLITANAGVGIASGQVPAALHLPESNKTLVGWQGPADASSDGDPYLTEYWHDYDTWGVTVKAGTNNLPPGDGHGEPTVVAESKEKQNGHIYVFWGSHNTELNAVRMTSGDHEIFGGATSAQDLSGVPNGTYPSVDIHEASQDIYATYRPNDADSHDGVYPSHEYGTVIVGSGAYDRNWSDLGPIVDLTGHPSTTQDYYVRHAQMLGDRFYISFTIARGTAHDGDKKGAYLIYYDVTDDTVYAPDGTSFGSTATWTDLDGSNAQLVGDSNQIGYQTQFIANATDDIHYTHKSDTNNEARYHHWDGSTWTTEKIGAGTFVVHPALINGEIYAIAAGAFGGQTVRVLKRDGGNWHMAYGMDELTPPGGMMGVPRRIFSNPDDMPWVVMDNNQIHGESGIYAVGDVASRSDVAGALRRPPARQVANVDTANEIGNGETVIDMDRGGTGTTSLVYKDESGTVHYWDADGTL